MKTFASKLIGAFIVFLQILYYFAFPNVCFGRLGNFSKSTGKNVKMISAPSNKLLSKNVSQIVGSFLDPDSAQKMRRTNKQWRNVNIYENISANAREIAIYRHLETKKIIWEATEFRNDKEELYEVASAYAKFSREITERGVWRSTARYWQWLFRKRGTIPNKEKLVPLLRDKNWRGVFNWTFNNVSQKHSQMTKPNNSAFTKQLMLAIGENFAQCYWATYFLWIFEGSQTSAYTRLMMLPIAKNIDVTFTGHTAFACPLTMAARLDDEESILALIERGADVNKVHMEWTALNAAAAYGNLNACKILLDKKAGIDARINDNLHGNVTPLIHAAFFGFKDVLQLLVDRGANKDLVDLYGKTALQYAREQKHDECIRLLINF